jgi:hypothetical protein
MQYCNNVRRKKNLDSQYKNIIDWLKKDPVCKVAETIDDDNAVSIINTSYFEDFKIGINVFIRMMLEGLKLYRVPDC